MTSFEGNYLGGHPQAPGALPRATLSFDDAGIELSVVVPARVVFATVVEAAHSEQAFTIGWHEIASLSAEGPETPRVAMLDAFALAIPKEVKSSCCVVGEGSFGEFYFVVRRKSVHELKAELAPWAVRCGLVRRDLAATHEGDHLLRTLKELAELRARGALTEEEFALAKARVLGTT